MIICIDSCVFIRGFQKLDPPTMYLLQTFVPEIHLCIPRIVVQEVTRNLRTQQQLRDFYRFVHDPILTLIVDEPVPPELVNKYIQMGLNQKGDAIIGAFAEWKNIDYLISNNRHFLRILQPEAFMVLDVKTFLSRWNEGSLSID